MVDTFLQKKLQPNSENETALSSQTVRYLRGLLRRAWRFGMKCREKTMVLTGEELPDLLAAFSDRRGVVYDGSWFGIAMAGHQH